MKIPSSNGAGTNNLTTQHTHIVSVYGIDTIWMGTKSISAIEPNES